MEHPSLEYRLSVSTERPAPYLIDDYLRLPSYELSDERMKIHDVVWGDCEIGDKPYDELLVKLANTPLFQRLQSIEQLTLGPQPTSHDGSTSGAAWYLSVKWSKGMSDSANVIVR